MKWSPTGSSSQVWMMRPCFTEQGMERTSITLSAPMRFSVCIYLLSYFVVGCWLKISCAGDAPAYFGHHRGMPRRIPNDLNVHVVDAFEAKQNIFHAFGDAVVHRAARRGERHRHRQFSVGVSEAINEAEVHDVDADFRVNHLAQGFEDKIVVSGAAFINFLRRERFSVRTARFLAGRNGKGFSP